MKCFANGFIAFVISLFIGISAVSPFLNKEPTLEIGQERVEPGEAPKPKTVDNIEFKPEFTQLPDYEELNFPKLPDNFIDLYNTDGLLRRSEVLAKTGEKWLVMSEANGKYRIHTSVAKVKQLKSASYPGDENDAQLSFPGTGKPVFALRNIPGIEG